MFCMRKYLFLFLVPFSLFAIYQGNPAEPQIIESGFFLSNDKFLNFKIGYQGDWVRDRKMKSIANNKGRIDRFEIHMDQGVFTMDILDRLEAYVSYGSFSAELSHRPEPDGGRREYQSHDRMTLGGGLRFILMQWGSTIVGVDGAMQYANPRMKWSALDGTPSAKPCRLNYMEYQTSIAITEVIGIFFPYLGVSYSGVHAHLDRIPSFILPNAHIKMRNRERYGLALGCALSSGKKVDLNFEVRLFTEQALSLAGNVKF